MLQLNNKTSAMPWITKRLCYPLHNKCIFVCRFRYFIRRFYYVPLFNGINPFLPNIAKLTIHFANERCIHVALFHMHTIPNCIIAEIHLRWSKFGTVTKLNRKHVQSCVCFTFCFSQFVHSSIRSSAFLLVHSQFKINRK